MISPSVILGALFLMAAVFSPSRVVAAIALLCLVGLMAGLFVAQVRRVQRISDSGEMSLVDRNYLLSSRVLLKMGAASSALGFFVHSPSTPVLWVVGYLGVWLAGLITLEAFYQKEKPGLVFRGLFASLILAGCYQFLQSYQQSFLAGETMFSASLAMAMCLLWGLIFADET